jgi:hypothetical protein
MLLLFAGCSGNFSRSIPATAGAERGAARHIVFRVADAKGRRIDWSAFRQREENGAAGYRNDALLDPATLLLLPRFARAGARRRRRGVSIGDYGIRLFRRRNVLVVLRRRIQARQRFIPHP